MTSFSDFAKPAQPAANPGWGGRLATPLFVAILVLGLVAVGWRAVRQGDAAKALARAESRAIAAAMDRLFQDAEAAAEILSARIVQGGGQVPDFQKIAADLLRTRPGIASLELQPGGILREIAPTAGNERALGFAVFTDPAHGPAAQLAKNSRVLTISGPLRLYSGRPGFTIRAPVFLRSREGREAFWGFTAVSITLEQLVARSGCSALPGKGFEYSLSTPAFGPQPAVVLAARGNPPPGSSILQSVQAQNLRLQLALRPAGGWIPATGTGLEVLAVVTIAGLAWLVGRTALSTRSLEIALAEISRRADREAAENKQAQDALRKLKETAASAQADLAKARATARPTEPAESESPTKAELALRNQQEALAGLKQKLDESEQLMAGLQTRLDDTIRASERTSQGLQADLDQALAAKNKADHTIQELREQLDFASRAAAADLAAEKQRLAEEQETVANLRTRLAAVETAATHSAASWVAKFAETQNTIRDLKLRLEASERPAPAPEPQNAAEPPATMPAPEPGDSPDWDVGPVTAADLPAPEESEPAAAAEPATEPEAEPFSEAVAPIRPPSPAEEKPAAIEPTPQAEAEPEATPPPAKKAARPAASAKPPKEPRELPEPAPAKPSTGSTTRLRKKRPDNQMDLFGGPAEAAPAQSAAKPEKTPTEESRPTPKREPDLEPVEKRASPTPKPESPLPPIQGLATESGLARAEGDTKVYLKSLRQFVDEHHGTPEAIRDALEAGKPDRAEQLAREFRAVAEQIGADSVSDSADLLVRRIHDQGSPDQIENLWKGLDSTLRELLAELKPALKTRDEKPAAPRASRPPPPVDTAELRKAVNQIVPLFSGQDPGAKDCLKDNRETFRAAFPPDVFPEFERSVKGGDYNSATEHLRRAAKKHGINV